MIHAICGNCAQVNEAPEMNNRTFRSICGKNGVPERGCNSFIPLERWQTENGFKVMLAMHKKKCPDCGMEFWGESWKLRCLLHYVERKERING